MVLYYKDCQNFDAAEKIVEEAEEHALPKNFEIISESMEASTVLMMASKIKKWL